MNLARTLLAAVALASTSTPVLADAITFDAASINQAFTLNYNGFSSGTTIDGLTAQATFTLKSILNDPQTNQTIYNFDYTAANTSAAPVTGSRLSGFAFNTDPTLNGASSTGDFAYATLSKTYPNGIGTVDVCFKDAQTGSCAGGAGGGLTQGTSGAGTIALTFGGLVSAVTLSDFYVRYQSIAGVPGISSASGSGTLTSTSTGGTDVPEPGMLGLLAGGLVAIGLVRRRRANVTFAPINA